jgi:hypothetical protein
MNSFAVHEQFYRFWAVLTFVSVFCDKFCHLWGVFVSSLTKMLILIISTVSPLKFGVLSVVKAFCCCLFRWCAWICGNLPWRRTNRRRPVGRGSQTKPWRKPARESWPASGEYYAVDFEQLLKKCGNKCRKTNFRPFLVLDPEKHDLSWEGHLTLKLFCGFPYFFTKINKSRLWGSPVLVLISIHPTLECAGTGKLQVLFDRILFIYMMEIKNFCYVRLSWTYSETVFFLI